MTDVQRILAELVDAAPGAQWAAVGGMDGLLVDHVGGAADTAAAAIAELTTVVAATRRTFGDILESAPLHELFVRTGGSSGAVWLVADDYYCVLVTDGAHDVASAREPGREAARRVRALLES